MFAMNLLGAEDQITEGQGKECLNVLDRPALYRCLSGAEVARGIVAWDVIVLIFRSSVIQNYRWSLIDAFTVKC